MFLLGLHLSFRLVPSACCAWAAIVFCDFRLNCLSPFCLLLFFESSFCRRHLVDNGDAVVNTPLLLRILTKSKFEVHGLLLLGLRLRLAPSGSSSFPGPWIILHLLFLLVAGFRR